MNLVEDDDLYNKEEIIKLLKSEEIIEKFKSENINSVVVFGSVLTEEFEDYSDVDIAILSENKISLNNIMELEESLSSILKREIDVIDLNNENLSLRFKVSVYDSGIVIYNDKLDLYSKDYNKTDIIYKNNEEFRYFRERDVIYDE